MKPLGVVIVTYNAAPVIRDCLESLLASGANLRVVVIDNASTDETLRVIEDWQSGRTPYQLRTNLPFCARCISKPVTTIRTIAATTNGGFAAGVNMGLEFLLADPELDRFWILNPDTLVPPDTPAALAAAPGGFSLMGGRILYADPPHKIQIDAGTINRLTGVTSNINLGEAATAGPPDMRNASFISGAHMVASRAFIEAAGLMPENYFLYYEEVDWAQHRADLPLSFCPDAPVYHRAGTSIGSPTLTSIASEFSVFYKHRARVKYLRRFHPLSWPFGYAYGVIKAAQLAYLGHRPQARAVLRALHGHPF